MPSVDEELNDKFQGLYAFSQPAKVRRHSDEVNVEGSLLHFVLHGVYYKSRPDAALQ